jgi:enterochelin esterase-like enzyme
MHRQLSKRVFALGRRSITRWKERKRLDHRVQPLSIRSRALGIAKRLYVYTPPGSAQSRASLPVLYFFRGHEHEWINPGQDASRAGRTVIDVYEELLASGAVGPMLLVFPGISSDDNSISGLLTNFKHPDLTTKPGIGSGRFEDYLMQDVLPLIDRRYRTRPGARGVQGFSLGGFMAAKIAAQHPADFRTVGAYDGLYFWDDPADAHSIACNDATFNHPMFDPAFGATPQRDRRYAAANNPSNLIRTGDAATLERISWIIEYGPQTGEPGDSNFYRGEHLCKLLAEKRIDNRGRGELKSGTHNWHCADEHMRYVLPLHWAALSQT